MSLQRRYGVWALMLLCGTGCGAAKSAMGLALPINDEKFEAVLGHGEFNDRNNSIECLSLRGKVDASRLLFAGSSEMGTVADTTQWKSLQDAYDAFKAKNCPPITDNQDSAGDACSALGEDVVQAWNDVQNTPAWEAAQDNSNYQDLLKQWHDGKSIDCYKH